MAGGRNSVLRQLRYVVLRHQHDGLADAQLLRLFVRHGDDSAFETLVRRHGPMVLSICSRTVGNAADAEDAFQATFLILFRRAATIRTKLVGNWLYGVAHRIALDAKRTAAKRRVKEAALMPRSHTEDDHAAELSALLDEELSQLPEKYRAVIVLCDLEGKTIKDVAKEIGCPAGTVASRLARGRQMLAKRLSRRGIGLSVAGLTSALAANAASAHVPMTLVMSTLNSATLIAAGETAAISANIGLLMNGALKAMLLTKLKIITVVLVATVILTAGTGGWMYATQKSREAKPQAHEKPPVRLAQQDIAKPAGPDEKKPRLDAYGDPLPEGAVARLGTVRQRAPDSDISVTPDGKQIVAVGKDLVVRRFSATTGELISAKALRPDKSSFVRLSPSASFLIASSFNPVSKENLQMWDLLREEIVQTLPLDRAVWIEAAAFSKDESAVALLTSESDIGKNKTLLWNIKTNSTREYWSETKQRNKRYAYDPAVAFSPDGKLLATWHLDLNLRVWDVASGKALWEAKTWAPFLFFSADGRTVLSGGDAALKIRNATTGEEAKPERAPPKGANYLVGQSPDGKYLAFEDGLESLKLWEPGSEKFALELPSPFGRKADEFMALNFPPRNFAFTPDGKSVIRRSGTLQRWELESGKNSFANTESWGHTESIKRVLFSPDGRWLASTGDEQITILWNKKTGLPTQVISQSMGSYLAFSPDSGNLLATPRDTGKAVLKAWRTDDGNETRSWDLAERKDFSISSNVRELRVTSDGKAVLMLSYKNGRAGDQCVISSWEFDSGKLTRHEIVPWGEDALITADGKFVVAVDSQTATARLWSIENARPIWQLKSDRVTEPMERGNSGRFVEAPDHRLVAIHLRFFKFVPMVAMSRKYDEFIRIADMRTGQQLVKIPVEGAAHFAFSGNGRLLAIADHQGLRFFDMISEKEIGRIPPSNPSDVANGESFATALDFSPDGRTVATGHSDSTILIWEVPALKNVNDAPLKPAEREALWSDVTSEDAARAYSAVRHLAEDAQGTMPFLKERLHAVTPAPADEVRALIADLDSDSFSDRQNADNKLRELGESAGPGLRAALKLTPALERTRRLEKLLKPLDAYLPDGPNAFRAIRAVQVLEMIATPEALQLLDHLATGIPEARLTREASEAKARLRRQVAQK